MKGISLALLAFTIAIACGLALLFRPDSGRWGVVEERFSDYLTALRVGYFPTPLDPRIRLIGIDEETVEYMGKPVLYWGEDFALLAQGLLDGGATVVGQDFILAAGTRKLAPALAESILTSMLPLLQAVVVTQKIVIVDLPDSAISNTHLKIHEHPQENLAEAALSCGNLAGGVVYPGSDGIFRSILVLYGETRIQSFALRMASLLSGKAVSGEGQKLRLGDREIPVKAYGHELTMRVDFHTDPFPWTSAGDLLNKLRSGQRLQGFEGCVCIIAPHAASLGDYRNSSMDLLRSKADEGGTFGAEIHAAALDNLLSGHFLVPYSASLAIGLSVLLALISFYLGYRVRLSRSLIGELFVQLFYLLICVGVFIKLSLWLPYTSVLLSSAVGYFSGYTWRYLAVEKERRRTREFFSRMIAPQVVDRVLSDPALQTLGGQARRVTVLYSDINHFTPMCERHTPSEVIVMLNAYFEEMVRIVFAHEGMLKQFVGDEIMVIYGAPVDQSDHAARAVRTALEMQDRLAELLALSGGQDGFYDIKFGINTGDVVVGHVGSVEHMEYAAVGDDVNLGARIMATTKKVGVNLLISAVTKAEAEPHLSDVEWISHGVHSFKGKTAQVELFEVRRKSAFP